MPGIQLKPARFPFGHLVFTRGVHNKATEDGQFMAFVVESLNRHGQGDWGEMCAEDKRENDFSLKMGNLRIFSAYEKDGLPKIWVITEADRSVTTVLFPDEY